MALVNSILNKGINLADNMTRYISAPLAKPITKADISTLKYAPHLKTDVVSFSQNPLAKLFTRVNKANNFDDLTILAHQIDKFKCSDSVRKELITRYVERYNKVHIEHCLSKPLKAEDVFKNIFGKELNPQESKELCETYKTILKEPNLLNYIGKLIMQVRKDYDIVAPMFRMNIKPKEGIGLGGSGAMSNTLDFMNLTYYNDNPLNRIKLFDTIMHELKHAKQNELALAVDKDAYISALVANARKKPQNAKYSTKELEQLCNKYFDDNLMAKIRAKYGTISKDSPLYKQGMDYIECRRNYIAPEGNFDEKLFREYKQQLTEKEAYDVSEKARELYYLLQQ